MRDRSEIMNFCCFENFLRDLNDGSNGIKEKLKALQWKLEKVKIETDEESHGLVISGGRLQALRSLRLFTAMKLEVGLPERAD